MLTGYESFKDKITAMIKIRSANYVNTDCDITAMISSVYEELAISILFEKARLEYTVLDVNQFTTVDNNSTDSDLSTMTKKYSDVLDIVDEYDVSILKDIHLVDDNTYRWNNYSGVCSTENGVPSILIGKNIYVIRKSISSIETLTIDVYGKIFPAMLEGIMYYIQTALPNQVDGQVGNYSYQRYYNAKKALINLIPQHDIQHQKDYKWL